MRSTLIAALGVGCAVMVLVLAGLRSPAHGRQYEVPALLAPYESGNKDFREVKIKDKFTVYYHQRMVGEAIVERDRIVYQFDMKTGELLSRHIHWRDDVPDRLPSKLMSAKEAALFAGGDSESAILQIMSPESIVFSFDIVPTNPCWIVRQYSERGELNLVAVDAVEGKIVGNGILPSVSGFSMVGGDGLPENCTIPSGWAPFAQRAEDWFEGMGYPTTYMEGPAVSDVREQVQSNEIAVFYEIAHSDPYYFINDCGEVTRASDIHDWLAEGSGYEKMVFTFLHSCDAMCDQGGPGTLRYEFRKGSDDHTAVVGYCGRTEQPCWNCANNSDDFEEAFFDALSGGATVGDAFDQACAAVPECLNEPHAGKQCVCLEGDGDLDLVPTRVRKPSVSWADVTASPLNDPQYGWGVAWGDYDNDGDPDIFLANQQDPLVLQGTNKLFRNDGGGTFTDATGTGPLADTGVTRAGAWGDYDNDGDLDLYVANDGTSNKILKNLEIEGQSDTFEDVTSAADLPSDQWHSWGVAWADYDGDGFLDFYVVNDGDGNKLYRNDGDGTFSDVTSTAGPVGDIGQGRGAAWGDYDNDGDPDLYLVKYNSDTNILCVDCPNRLFRNEGDGTFSDVTESAGPLADENNGMMASWGDYDNDGDLDLYLVNYSREYVPAGNKLFRNDGDGDFTDVTDASHGFNVSSGVACAWADFDNDGDLDLLAVNRYAEDRLFRNEASESPRFVNAADAITGHKEFGSSAAWGDYDGDGDLDIYLASLGGAHTNRLFQNHTNEDLDNNWLRVKVVGTESNRSGIGCRVRIEVDGLSQIREISGGPARSQGDLWASFGLGSATQIDVLEVDWPGPCHNVTVMNGVAANQVVTVTEGVSAANCSFAFAQDTPSCPFTCPSGDASYNGHAPLRLEVTVRDGCGDPVEGYDDFYVTITPSSVGNFKFCCSGTEPTVQSATRMVASAPTNAEGKAWVDIYWGGGYDQALAMKCYLDGGEQIGGALESRVRTPDLNADCAVTQQDVGLFAQSYHTTNWWADFNCSGYVDLSDFAFLGTHNGHGCENQQTQPLSQEEFAHILKRPESGGSALGDDQAIPDKFSLAPNVPNPFNPSTEIRFTVPEPGARVLVEIFDVSGRRVSVLVDEYKAPGLYSAKWSGIDESGEPVSSGVYFCRLQSPGFSEQRKLVLLK